MLDVKFSNLLTNTLNRLSQSAVADMCDGADDPVLVAEITLTMLDHHEYKSPKTELDDLIKHCGYDAVLKKISEIVAVL